MVIDRAALEAKVVALMNDGQETQRIGVHEARALKDDAKVAYNPENMKGNPEEALLKSIIAARVFARYAKTEERMRWEDREALIIQSKGMYQFAMNVAKSAELVATGELIYKEFDSERVELGRKLKEFRRAKTKRQVLIRQIRRREYGR